MQDITINGFNNFPKPTQMSFGLVPFFGASTMTTQQGKTLTGVTKWKRKLVLTWTDLKASDAHNILFAVYGSQYKAIVYHDPYSNQQETKVFYMENEQSLPLKCWKVGKQYYTSVTFEFIERECSGDINS